jgi:hypothetical protein
MGNRDHRSREKKKPKKTEAKPVYTPSRPVTTYKPTPVAPVVPSTPAPGTEKK